MTEQIQAIEAQLRRIGWLSTEATPCYFAVCAEEDLPRGWVRMYDDTLNVYGAAKDVLAALEAIGEETEYGEGLDRLAEKAPDSNEWPEELIKFERLKEGSTNENPDTLITVETNGGTRYAAGPHGVSYCALSDWYYNCGPLAKTREEAIDTGTSDEEDPE